MANTTFYERLSKILDDRGLKQNIAANIAGVSQGTISRITSDEGKKEVTQIDGYINLCENDDQKYYLVTGKHLPQESTHTPNNIQEIHREMLQTIRELNATVRGLQEEIHQMREENKNQGRITHSRSKVKVPDH